MNLSGNALAGMEAVNQPSPIERPEPARPLSEEVQGVSRPDLKSLNRSEKIRDREADPDQQTLTREDVAEMIEALEELTQTLQTKLSYSINENTNDIVVKVLDKETDEVIKQFPPEELLELQEKMLDLTGFLFDTDV